MPSPRQTFDDNIRPVSLLLRIYGMLDTNDHVLTEGELVEALRVVVKATPSEYLMVVTNDLFVGMVRERADVPPATLRRATLAHLLRQAVVTSCTALETYLPALLRENLPTVIAAKRRAFLPDDDQIRAYFKDMKFDLVETMRLLEDPDPALYISSKMMSLLTFKYVTGKNGVYVAGRLLGLNKPWDEISAHLQRSADKKDLMDTLERTIARRNDIVHRADRGSDAPDAEEPQEITYAFARQAVDTVQHTCLALDELVAMRMAEYKIAVANQ